MPEATYVWTGDVERLTTREANERIDSLASFLGLPPDHEMFAADRAALALRSDAAPLQVGPPRAIATAGDPVATWPFGSLFVPTDGSQVKLNMKPLLWFEQPDGTFAANGSFLCYDDVSRPAFADGVTSAFVVDDPLPAGIARTNQILAEANLMLDHFLGEHDPVTYADAVAAWTGTDPVYLLNVGDPPDDIGAGLRSGVFRETTPEELATFHSSDSGPYSLRSYIYQGGPNPDSGQPPAFIPDVPWTAESRISDVAGTLGVSVPDFTNLQTQFTVWQLQAGGELPWAFFEQKLCNAGATYDVAKVLGELLVNPKNIAPPPPDIMDDLDQPFVP